MTKRRGLLLLIDGIVNLLLGILLLLYPTGLADALGLPPFSTTFYPTMLGAVLFGIGVALVIQRYRAQAGLTGLGIAGAIAINLCGGGVLLVWLLAGHLRIPLKGRIILWAVAIVVLLIGILEAVSGSWHEGGDRV
jgi:hypothetical protein